MGKHIFENLPQYLNPSTMDTSQGSGGGIQTKRIDKVHGIVLHVGIAIERLRIGQIVTSVIRIRLHEAVPFACVATHPLLFVTR